MPVLTVASLLVTAILVLSILYLRCTTDEVKQFIEKALKVTFKSLFEMPCTGGARLPSAM